MKEAFAKEKCAKINDFINDLANIMSLTFF